MKNEMFQEAWYIEEKKETGKFGSKVGFQNCPPPFDDSSEFVKFVAVSLKMLKKWCRSL